MRRLHLIITLLLLSFTAATAQQAVHPTRYNWINVATTITEGCTNDYERVEAIYKWICANISYDTSMSIYHADECWDNKRGVCQAYSELFYYIAQALGIRVDIIQGDVKSISNDYGRHSWLYAETDKQRHVGILIDPTFGAGSVNNGVFTRNQNDMSWFNVNPRIMIFTHFPDNPSYQLLEQPLSVNQFQNLPPLAAEVEMLGLNGNYLLNHCSNNPSAVPHIYSIYGNPPFYIEEAPMQSTLRPGQTYRFTIRRIEKEFAIVCNNEFIKNDKWQYSNGAYTIYYTVPCDNKLSIMWYDEKKNYYNGVLEYNISQPTEVDLHNLAAKEPYYMPELKNLRGFNRDLLKEFGFDGKRLLSAVQRGEVTSLPTFYSEFSMKVVDVPLNGTLNSGQTYYFRIRPTRAGNWAIINGDNWHQNWTKSLDGNEIEIMVTPSPGILRISIQHDGKGSYWSCIEYNVK